MRRTDLPPDAAAALGALLAHAVRIPGGALLKKGRRLSEKDARALALGGVATVPAALLDPDDVGEDAAAARIAVALAGPGLEIDPPFTGRCNLYATGPGLALIDAAAIDAVNALDEAVTVATLAPYDLVGRRTMVATVKIIPFAAPSDLVVRACAAARPDGVAPAVRVAPFRPRRAGLIQTQLDGGKPETLDAAAAVTRDRLEQLGARLIAERRVGHAVAPVAAALAELAALGCDLLLIAGASAVTDRADVAPAALTQLGGVIDHLGMPVDPGNLMLVGRLGATPVVVLPGCARSPKLNGFDWVLRRLLAELPVGPREIMGMGVGGLLSEIPLRPQPRAAAASIRPPKVAALLLAAGRSQRMGRDKLLLEAAGEPLIRRAALAALASQCSDLVVTLGPDAAAPRAALAGLPATIVENPQPELGLSSSLRQGLAAVPADVDAVLVLLADMPLVDAALIDRVIAAYDPAAGRRIVAPASQGRRGHPVLWDKRYFPAMAGLQGDVGARSLLERFSDAVYEIPTPSEAAFLDLDTPDAYADFLQRFHSSSGDESGL